MSRNIHGNLNINNGNVTIQGDEIFESSFDRSIYVSDTTALNGARLSIRAGGSSTSNAKGGDLVLRAGSATFGGLATGGEVFISGGTNGGGTTESIYIGGDGSPNISSYLMRISPFSVGIGTDEPISKLHVNDGNGVLPVINSSTLGVFSNTSGDANVSILSGSSNISTLNFGDNTSEASGKIVYFHSFDAMGFLTNSNTQIPSMMLDNNFKVGLSSGNTPVHHVTFNNSIGIGTKTIISISGTYETSDLDSWLIITQVNTNVVLPNAGNNVGRMIYIYNDTAQTSTVNVINGNTINGVFNGSETLLQYTGSLFMSYISVVGRTTTFRWCEMK